MTGHWILITGGARRVGAAIARELHRRGANIVVSYRSSATEARSLVGECNALRADSALAFQTDLLEPTALTTLADTVIAECGSLHALVNNASSFYPTPVGEIGEQQWHDLIGTNLKAPLFLSQALAPALGESRGSIVNIVDIHARRPLRHHAVYGAAKAGLEMLTRSLARDLAPDVRVNAVAPGAVLWPEHGVDDAMRKNILAQIPLARRGEPEDVASCVLYLIRDAHYVTGQTICVDGGRSIGW